MRTSFKVLFYVLFENQTWDLVPMTVVMNRGTPEREIIMQASLDLDRQLEKDFYNKLCPNVIHVGQTFPVHSIYEV